jgi:hypothetical protein
MKLFLLGIIFSITAYAGIVPNHEQQIQINIGQGLVQLVAMNKSGMTRLFNTIWKDQSVPACTVWSDLGTNAAPLRESFFGLVTFINSQSPGAISLSEPSGYSMTENGDGTVTCVAPTPSPSPTPTPTPSP